MNLQPRLRSEPLILFYDGQCGFCQRSVRFIIMHDRRDEGAVRVAPLQGETARRVLGDRLNNLPDSAITRDEHDRLHVKSSALLVVLDDIGGRWRIFARIGFACPRLLRDAAYDMVAKVRKWIPLPVKDVCPMIPPEKRSRFLP